MCKRDLAKGRTCHGIDASGLSHYILVRASSHDSTRNKSFSRQRPVQCRSRKHWCEMGNVLHLSVLVNHVTCSLLLVPPRAKARNVIPVVINIYLVWSSLLRSIQVMARFQERGLVQIADGTVPWTDTVDRWITRRTGYSRCAFIKQHSVKPT